MSVTAVLAVITCAIGFIGFSGVSAYCFSGQDKLVGFGIFCGFVGLVYGIMLALVVVSL